MTIRVTSMSGKDGERLLQKFKRICVKEGILKEIKRRQFYESPRSAGAARRTSGGGP